MTAPAGITALQAQVATLQAQIDALSARPRSTAATRTAAPAASTISSTAPSAAAFASSLAQATGSPAKPAPTVSFGTAVPTGAATAPSGTAVTGGAVTGGAVTGGTVARGATVTGASVVADAKRYLGIPYVWGGESASGLDCSGLVQKTFSDLGIHVPRVAADQQNVGTPVASLAQAQPGDLLFFGRPAYHVAIYAGGGQLIESPEPGKTVHVTHIYQTPTSIRRIVDAPAPVSVAATGGLTGGPTGGMGAAQLVAAGLNPAVAAYAGQFAAAESAYGLPHGLLAAVAQQESGGNVRAVSPAGAQGLMQLMPGTAAAAGADAFDPAQAIPAAAKILARDLHSFGSVPLALAAYNAGAGAVQRYGGIPPYTETQNYVRRITAMLAAGG